MANKHKSSSKMCKLFILEVESSSLRSYDTKMWFIDGEFGEWIWAEGNYSCDCNRKMFFDDVNINETDEAFPCSDGKYLVKIMDGKTILYDEIKGDQR